MMLGFVKDSAAEEQREGTSPSSNASKYLVIATLKSYAGDGEIGRRFTCKSGDDRAGMSPEHRAKRLRPLRGEAEEIEEPRFFRVSVSAARRIKAKLATQRNGVDRRGRRRRCFSDGEFKNKLGRRGVGFGVNLCDLEIEVGMCADSGESTGSLSRGEEWTTKRAKQRNRDECR